MRNICLFIVQMMLFLTTYLVACFIPAFFIFGANAILDPSAAWPCVAEAWLGSHGVPYPEISMTVGYCLAVFYPAIQLAIWTAFDKADSLFNALMRDES